MTAPPTQEEIQNLIEIALNEDVGPGDLTTRLTLTGNRMAAAEIIAKEPLVLAGLDIAQAVFKHLDENVTFPLAPVQDGDTVAQGACLMRVRGDARKLLIGERTALNIMQRLSGIATLTRNYVDAAGPVKVLDTRKTTPGLRVFEKYAVRMGGGSNHRFGLHDGILIKDNHVRAAGSIAEAVRRAQTGRSDKALPVEVETSSLREVEEAVLAEADIILLDNMTNVQIREAVELIQGRAQIEASGSMTVERVQELAGSGIDRVSVGALTHSASAADISMNFL